MIDSATSANESNSRNNGSWTRSDCFVGFLVDEREVTAILWIELQCCSMRDLGI